MRLMRGLLLIPPDDEKALAAVAAGAGDGLILDLADESDIGRKGMQAALVAVREKAPALPLYGRIADLAAPRADSDLAAIMAGQPDGILLGRAESGADLQHLSVKLSVYEAELGLAEGLTKIIAAVATPTAILDLASFAGKTQRLAGLVFAEQALAKAMQVGTGRLPDDGLIPPLASARAFTLLAAKAAGVAAIDDAALPDTDDDKLRQLCEAAKRDGFNGKLARDLRQLAVINSVFKSDLERNR